MCKFSEKIFSDRRKKCFFSITENRGLIFPDDRIIIRRSASLCLRGWLMDFNDSFSNLNPVALRASSKWWWWWGVADQIPLWHLIQFFPQQLNVTLFSRLFFFPLSDHTCAPWLNCPIYLFVSIPSLLFHPILLPAFISLLISAFCFCGWWKDSRAEKDECTWSSQRASNLTYLRAPKQRQLS